MEKYKHFDDLRSAKEIRLTDILIQSVSDYNLLLHQKNQYKCLHANKDLLTITINGVPANPLEFQGFIFTKNVVNYFPPCFELDKSEEYLKERIHSATMQIVVEEIDQIVRKHNNKVIFVSHSFGSYLVTAYTHKYPEKIIGIIQFGCIPVTVYQILKQFGQDYIFGEKALSRESILRDSDNVYEQYKKWIMTFGMQSLFMKSKYTLLSFYYILNSKIVQDMFEWRRQYPKILKLITFGRRDQIFEVDLLNEMAQHFTYGGGSLQPDYDKKMCQKYTAITNLPTNNIQQRFIYSFPKAGHGLHIKRKQPLQNFINLYLALMLSDQPEKPAL